MPAPTSSETVERRAARRVAWRERLLGVAAVACGPLRGEARAAWDRGAPVLLYHRVYAATRVPAHDPFGITRAAFEAHVRWLRERFVLYTVRDLVTRLREGKSGAGMAAITFDDGYSCTHREAWPVLRDLGVPATLFVDTARLDGPAPALSAGKLMEMANEGLEIGSHTESHRDLTTLAPPEVEHELTASRRRLEQLTGRLVEGVAPPYGRYDAQTEAAARAAGYRYLCTCRQHRTNEPGAAPFLIDRLEVNRGDGTRHVARKLRGRYARVYATWYRFHPATRHWVTA